MTGPPLDDADVPRYWRELGLPGLVDVHVHFLPERVQAKVWNKLAHAQARCGAAWPVQYPPPEEERLSRPGVAAAAPGRVPSGGATARGCPG